MATSDANYYSIATPPILEGASDEKTVTPPAESDARPAESDAKPVESDAKPVETDSQPAEGAISTVSLENIQIQDPSKDISFR